MNTNQRYNETAIKQFRKELKAMMNDIRDIDVKCINRAVNEGIADAKRNTPVGQYSADVHFTTKDGEEVSFTAGNVKTGGFMRKSWHTTPTIKRKSYVEKSFVNTADYASYVNDGHRLVNRHKETVGFVKGQFILEKAESKANKAMEAEFRKEVERVNREHDK
ncbi:MAG: HK97 gp10 family phage protein [Ruminiclostridium sp.]